MATLYCSWATGNDTTGDGSAGNPYKTITKASTGISGGDEVRVEKSPANTALTGTLTFTNGSATVTGSGTAFTTELSAYDYIVDGNGEYHEISSIASDTSLTLLSSYFFTTASGVSSYKVGMTSTGEATVSQQVQVISSSGTSKTSRIRLTGGWDLSTETQTGETNFVQRNASVNTRNGYGLYASSKSFIEIDKLNFFRYTSSILTATSGSFWDITSIKTGGCSGYSLNLASLNELVIGDVRAHTVTYATYIIMANSSRQVYINGGVISGTQTNVIYCSGSSGFYVSNVTVVGTSSYSVYLTDGVGSTIKNCTFSGGVRATTYGGLRIENTVLDDVFADRSDVYCFNCTLSNATEFVATTAYTNAKLFSSKHDQTADNHWVFTDGGTINSLTNDRSGGAGLKWNYNITSSNRASNYPLNMVLMEIPCNASEAVTVTAYCKKNHATNVGAKLVCRGGQIAGVTSDVVATATDTTDWQQLSITFTPTEKGVIEIEGWGFYNAGNGYVEFADVNWS